ncbi:MAG TPA: hypothetical protein VF510_07010 [Ktedonobacterales bacterium]
MSGPGGTSTKRDQRRDTRRAQFQQRQAERKRARERQIRTQRIRRYSIIGGGILLIAVVAFFVVNAVINAGKPHTHTQYTTPASGDAREGLSCLGTEGLAEHFHVYLAIYANGQQVQVPANTGIVPQNGGTSACFYQLHVHGDPGDDNIIHIESPTKDPFTLGQFYAIWGQTLTKTQSGDYKADATHKLVYETVDDKGKVTTVTGDPWDIKLASHETIYVLYNSPNVKPVQFTKWLPNE